MKDFKSYSEQELRDSLIHNTSIVHNHFEEEKDAGTEEESDGRSFIKSLRTWYETLPDNAPISLRVLCLAVMIRASNEQSDIHSLSELIKQNPALFLKSCQQSEDMVLACMVTNDPVLKDVGKMRRRLHGLMLYSTGKNLHEDGFQASLFKDLSEEIGCKPEAIQPYFQIIDPDIERLIETLFNLEADLSEIFTYKQRLTHVCLNKQDHENFNSRINELLVKSFKHFESIKPTLETDIALLDQDLFNKTVKILKYVPFHVLSGNNQFQVLKISKEILRIIQDPLDHLGDLSSLNEVNTQKKNQFDNALVEYIKKYLKPALYQNDTDKITKLIQCCAESQVLKKTGDNEFTKDLYCSIIIPALNSKITFAEIQNAAQMIGFLNPENPAHQSLLLNALKEDCKQDFRLTKTILYQPKFSEFFEHPEIHHQITQNFEDIDRNSLDEKQLFYYNVYFKKNNTAVIESFKNPDFITEELLTLDFSYLIGQTAGIFAAIDQMLKNTPEKMAITGQILIFWLISTFSKNSEEGLKQWQSGMILFIKGLLPADRELNYSSLPDACDQIFGDFYTDLAIVAMASADGLFSPEEQEKISKVHAQLYEARFIANRNNNGNLLEARSLFNSSRYNSKIPSILYQAFCTQILWGFLYRQPLPRTLLRDIYQIEDTHGVFENESQVIQIKSNTPHAKALEDVGKHSLEDDAGVDDVLLKQLRGIRIEDGVVSETVNPQSQDPAQGAPVVRTIRDQKIKTKIDHNANFGKNKKYWQLLGFWERS